MPQFFLLFNHRLTPDQEVDARQNLGVDAFAYLPEALQAIWSQVPADAASLQSHVAPVQQWLTDQARPGDYALVQGDYGATYLLVQTALRLGVVALHGTTARQTVEHTQPDGSVKIERVFRHMRFREYGR
ncbi:MAG: hypothetical protein OHK0039_10370 [Bacteroidia bacterium]